MFVHQLTRIHGVLFSDFFEYGVLIVAGVFTTRQLAGRKWSLNNKAYASGTVSGVGATLFLDSVVVDYWLTLHSVGYSVAVVQVLGGLGFAIFLAGILIHLVLKSTATL